MDGELRSISTDHTSTSVNLFCRERKPLQLRGSASFFEKSEDKSSVFDIFARWFREDYYVFKVIKGKIPLGSGKCSVPDMLKGGCALFKPHDIRPNWYNQWWKVNVAFFRSGGRLQFGNSRCTRSELKIHEHLSDSICICQSLVINTNHKQLRSRVPCSHRRTFNVPSFFGT